MALPPADLSDRLGQGCHDIQIERLPGCAWLFCRSSTATARVCRAAPPGSDRWRTVDTDALAQHPASAAPRHRRRTAAAARAVSADEPISTITCSASSGRHIEQSVSSPGDPGEARISPFRLSRAYGSNTGCCFARLEKCVRILRRAADDGPLRRQRSAAMRPNQVVADHQADFVIRNIVSLLTSCGGRNPSKKCRKGRALSPPERSAPVSCASCTEPERSGRNLWTGPPSRPNGRRKSTAPHWRLTRRHVEDRRRQFAGDLVHVRYH